MRSGCVVAVATSLPARKGTLPLRYGWCFFAFTWRSAM